MTTRRNAHSGLQSSMPGWRTNPCNATDVSVSAPRALKLSIACKTKGGRSNPCLLHPTHPFPSLQDEDFTTIYLTTGWTDIFPSRICLWPYDQIYLSLRFSAYRSFARYPFCSFPHLSYGIDSMRFRPCSFCILEIVSNSKPTICCLFVLSILTNLWVLFL